MIGLANNHVLRDEFHKVSGFSPISVSGNKAVSYTHLDVYKRQGVDELESIKNTYHKLYPEFNDHDTFFSTTGEEQIIYN